MWFDDNTRVMTENKQNIYPCRKNGGVEEAARLLSRTLKIRNTLVVWQYDDEGYAHFNVDLQ